MKHYTLPVTYDKYGMQQFIFYNMKYFSLSIVYQWQRSKLQQRKWNECKKKKMFRLISKKNHKGLDKLHWDHRMKAQRQVVKLWQEIE